jgi:uncharacterized MnhB-related membrane protein
VRDYLMALISVTLMSTLFAALYLSANTGDPSWFTGAVIGDGVVICGFVWLVPEKWRRRHTGAIGRRWRR